MASLNKVMLIGNLGKDAEVFTPQGGQQNKMSFTLATTEAYTDRGGERKENTEWHNIIYWCKSTAIANYLKKGTQVYVEGKITTRKYEDKYYTEIKAERVQLMGGKPAQNTTATEEDLPW